MKTFLSSTHIGVVDKESVGWPETLFCMHGCDGLGRHEFKLVFHNSSGSHPLFTFCKFKQLFIHF